jgi:plastocyanin
MSTRVLRFAVLALVVAAIAAATARSSAGPEKIAFPARYQDGILYTVADRYDVKQYRELYASEAAIRAAREGRPLPTGTVLTLLQFKAQVDAQGNPVKDARGRFVKGELIAYAVMEKRRGWGAEYADDIRNGEWEYALFGADGTFNDKANYKACFQCHKPHDAQDFVISYPAMAGKTMAASAPAPPAGSIGVHIGGFTFGPPGVTVAPGKTVTWTNTDDSPHQITVAGTSLKTGLLLKGQNGSLTFANEGMFPYSCALHPSMKGTVQVSR